jgi:hypothetical protein
VQKIFCRLRRQNMRFGGCVKSLFMALRAKLCFDRHVIFTISICEIVKMTCLSEEYSAAEVGKNLFAQPHYLLRDTSFLKFRFAKFQK